MVRCLQASGLLSRKFSPCSFDFVGGPYLTSLGSKLPRASVI